MSLVPKRDDAALGEHRPTDEERAVIGLVGSCRKRRRRTDLCHLRRKASGGIGPVFLRHHHFGPEFVLRVNHRVEPLLRSVLLRLKVDIPTVTRHIHHPRASCRHDTLSFSIDQTSTGQDQVVLRARHDYQSVPLLVLPPEF